METIPSKFPFSVGENEQIEAVIKLPKETRSVLHGIVKNHANKPIENAVVKLFIQEDSCNPCSLKPIAHTFTDECGQFIFGPLWQGKQYVIKVWYNSIKFRELIITANDCKDDTDEDYDYSGNMHKDLTLDDN